MQQSALLGTRHRFISVTGLIDTMTISIALALLTHSECRFIRLGNIYSYWKGSRSLNEVKILDTIITTPHRVCIQRCEYWLCLGSHPKRGSARKSVSSKVLEIFKYFSAAICPHLHRNNVCFIGQANSSWTYEVQPTIWKHFQNGRWLHTCFFLTNEKDNVFFWQKDIKQVCECSYSSRPDL